MLLSELENKTKSELKYKLSVDLDGVLAAFIKGVNELKKIRVIK